MERITVGSTHIRVRALGDDLSLTGNRVSLQKADRVVATQLLSRDGVVFEDVPDDRYRLMFSRDDKRIGAFAFEIEETASE